MHIREERRLWRTKEVKPLTKGNECQLYRDSVGVGLQLLVLAL